MNKMFRDIADSLKSTYNSNEDIANDFYNLVLSESVSYQRVSGFFSCRALAMYATGLDRLTDAGGRVRFIISTEISHDDFLQIHNGYQLRDAAHISDMELLSPLEKKKLGNLAYMISQGQADVKFGLRESGLFHSKWGYFEDKSSDTIYFIGSNNETASGISNNFEDFDVDVSWDTSKNVRERILQKKEQFELLWDDKFADVKVVSADDITYDMLKDYDVGHIQSLPGREIDALVLEKKQDRIVFVDHTKAQVLKKRSFSRRIQFYLDKYNPNQLKEGLNYRQIESLISSCTQYAKQHEIKFYVGDALQEYIANEKYSIREYQRAGLTLKSHSPYWDEKYKLFRAAVQREIVRSLKEEQIRAAFYFYVEKRAANFSVPGSGKTATMLGVFAYLNRSPRPVITRMLVICPLNAFDSWKDEFHAEFDGRKELRIVTVQQGVQTLYARWASANLVLVNYEALQSDDVLKVLLSGLSLDGGKTMLIFDEVHRIKGIEGKRAQAAKLLTPNTEYRYVLTGTPIPNGYIDIWNFLHLLYNDEYDSFFGFTQSDLKDPDNQIVANINNHLSPFFWRTNKQKLGVPKPEPDCLLTVAASAEQSRLAKLIYDSEPNPLVVMIRLIQLSTNPSLLEEGLTRDDFYDMGIGDDETDSILNKLHHTLVQKRLEKISDIDASNLVSPKFTKGINLVRDIVNRQRKVVIWALFVDTIDKINEALQHQGIASAVVYGATPSEERERIISTFKSKDSDIQVLITNPNTLGESMSLHETVHDAVYFEYNYNLTFMLQSRDRIHRLGLEQGQKTRYWYLMTVSNNQYGNFIDEKIYKRLEEKRDRMLTAIDSGILTPSYSDRELQEMTAIINSERRH